VRRLPYASLLLAAAAVLIALLPAGAARLQYDRLAIAAGEIWRLGTGHWTHVAGDHLFWDVLAFVVLGVPCEQYGRGAFVACVAGASGCIALALWVGMPHLQLYRGLSGIDAALFMLLTVTLLRPALCARHWGWVAALAGVCLAFLAKVGYEAVAGATLFVNSQAGHMVPVPLAHGVGAVTGLVVGWTRPIPPPVSQVPALPASTGAPVQ
jgi:rhomboid family GlyGly-CTERM serine protease